MSVVVEETGDGLRHLARVLVRWWVLIVTGTVLALGLGAVAVVGQSEQYRSEAEVLLPPPPVPIGSDAAREAVLNVNDLMATYAKVVESDAVLAAVLDEVTFDLSLRALRDSVSASAADGTLVLELTVIRSDEAEAEAISTALIEAFADQLPEVVPSVSPDGEELVDVVTLKAPSTTVLPRNVVRTLVLALVIGLGFTSVAAFVLDRS